LRRSSSVHSEAATDIGTSEVSAIGREEAKSTARARARRLLAKGSSEKVRRQALELSRTLDVAQLTKKSQQEDKVVEEAASLLFSLAGGGAVLE